MEHRHTRRSALEMYAEELVSDVRVGLRSLRRSPVLAASAVLTLVLGIGSITTVFSFVNVGFRPLPYPDADRIVALTETGQRVTHFPKGGVWLTVADHIRGANHSFERLTAYQGASAVSEVAGDAATLSTLHVDTSFRAMLGTPPARGRWFTNDEILRNMPVAVISDDLWQRLGGTAEVLAQPLRLNGVLHSVVGVMPPRFEFPRRTQVWVPFSLHPREAGDMAGQTGVSLLGKLRPGVDRGTARREMALLSAPLGDIDKRFTGDLLVVEDEMIDRRISAPVKLMIVLFLGAACFVLLIVCTNVGTLMVTRTAERRGEMAVRAALGASRGRLMRQMLAESLTITVIAGALGTAASVAAVPVVLSLLPATAHLPSWVQFGLDVRVLGLTLGVTVLVTVLVSLLPARLATRLDLVTSLKGGTAGSGRTRELALTSRRGLIVQISLSLSLFLGAALMVQSYRRTANFDFGFPADHMVTVGATFDPSRYPSSGSRVRLIEDVAARLQARNGGGIAAWAPTGWLRTRATTEASSAQTPAAEDNVGMRLDDRTIVGKGQRQPRISAIPDGYFAMLGLHLQRGRVFGPADGEHTVPVAIVSRAFAEVVFGNSDAVGHTLQQGAQGDRFVIVGVVSDVMDPPGKAQQALPSPRIYLSIRQADVMDPQLLARATRVDATKSLLVAALREADNRLAVGSPQTLDSDMGEQLMLTRGIGSLLGFFAVSGLLLAMVGIYGVVAYSITQRTREIGLRMALGGTSQAIIGLLLRDGLRFTLTGTGIGLAIAAASAKVVQRTLFGTSAFSPAVYIGATVVFGAMSMLACYLPARRVARVDPIVALRTD